MLKKVEKENIKQNQQLTTELKKIPCQLNFKNKKSILDAREKSKFAKGRKHMINECITRRSRKNSWFQNAKS